MHYYFHSHLDFWLQQQLWSHAQSIYVMLAAASLPLLFSVAGAWLSWLNTDSERSTMQAVKKVNQKLFLGLFLYMLCWLPISVSVGIFPQSPAGWGSAEQQEQQVSGFGSSFLVLLMNNVWFQVNGVISDNIAANRTYLTEKVAAVSNGQESLSVGSISEYMSFKQQCYLPALEKAEDYGLRLDSIKWAGDSLLQATGLYTSCGDQVVGMCQSGTVSFDTIPSRLQTLGLSRTADCGLWWNGGTIEELGKETVVSGLKGILENEIQQAAEGSWWSGILTSADMSYRLVHALESLSQSLSSSEGVVALPGASEDSLYFEVASRISASWKLATSAGTELTWNYQVQQSLPSIQAVLLAASQIFWPIFVCLSFLQIRWLWVGIIPYATISLWESQSLLARNIHESLWLLVLGNDVSAASAVSALQSAGSLFLWNITASFAWSIPLLLFLCSSIYALLQVSVNR